MDNRERRGLSTSRSVSEELWGTLSYLSDVRQVGLEFIEAKTSKTGNQRDDVFALFQACVRQAKSFGEAARTLHHRASPLLWYYCFLNLAKAVLCVRRPEVLLSPRIHHGLSERHAGGDFATESVETTHSGVFPEFYAALIGVSIPPSTKIHPASLFGYMSDVSFEVRQRMVWPIRRAKCFVRQPVDHKTKTTWALVAVTDSTDLDKLCPFWTAISDALEEVQLAKGLAERLFGLSGADFQTARFLQSKKTYPQDNSGLFAALSHARNALKLYFWPSPFLNEGDFVINAPLECYPSLPSNELVAGYILFFYLGSLVRYHPDYLERMLHAKESWLLEQFVTSSPTTLLRHFVSEILDETVLVTCR